MKTVICQISFVPLRKEPDHRSELVSQLLFGETAVVDDSRNEWLHLKTYFDSYTGWVEKGSVKEAEKEILYTQKMIVSDPFIHASNNEQEILLPAGSEIPFPDPNGCFYLGEIKWCIGKHEISERNHGHEIKATACKFLNAPYLWGGRTIFGIDCSGFTQLVFKIHQLKLPRDAKDQSAMGNPVKTLSVAQPGDLLFFNNKEGKITHTGILLEDSMIIHASKWVRIDKVDEKGIFNTQSKEYTHTLYCIRRCN